MIVVAGMEGALPSVVAGLLEAPVIAVPTSVGYGASFEGLAALLAMLNSCASGALLIIAGIGHGWRSHKINTFQLGVYPKWVEPSLWPARNEVFC